MIELVTQKAVSVTGPVVAAPAKTEKGVSVQNPANQAAPDVAPINPRLRYDAVSGVVITEFLDQTGGIQAQSPSTAVLAYLRAGLSKDGLNRADDETQVAE